jgi:hypothetical protein
MCAANVLAGTSAFPIKPTALIVQLVVLLTAHFGSWFHGAPHKGSKV